MTRTGWLLAARVSGGYLGEPHPTAADVDTRARLKSWLWVCRISGFDIRTRDWNNVPFSLNNQVDVCLLRATGALGDWDGAMSDYLEAAKDPAMEEVARANYALALFQVTIPKLVQNEVHIQIPKSPIIPLLVGGPSHVRACLQQTGFNPDVALI